MQPALVVGLGNPGPEYERTRHNAGFLVVDILARRLGVNLRAVKGMRSLAAEARDGDRRVILAKPVTYMNLSGEAVRELARYYKVAAADIVVVHDELDLPVAAVRVKRGGGDAGHNGLKHITRSLGTPEYARVRIGIGRPSGRAPAADYVLQPFRKDELDGVSVAFEQAADAVMSILRDGLEVTQNRLHGSGEQTAKERKLRKQVVVDAPVNAVWDAWTTTDGATTFFAPAANIEARVDGAYELYFDPDAAPGSRGSDGCRILALDAPRALSFTWNQPPSIPSLRTTYIRVDVTFRGVGKDRTRVTLTHSGWGEGEDWDRAYAYFDRAWDVVLDRLRRRFVDGPIDWASTKV